MVKVVRGMIFGKTIELANDPGIEDGHRVEVTIRIVAGPADQIEAILRTAGSMADDPKFDGVMGEIERDRDTAEFRDMGW